MHRWWQVWLWCWLWLATPWAWAQGVQLSRLDADPPPAQVLSGGFDRQFIVLAQPVLLQPDKQRYWWRLTAVRPIPPQAQPHLVLRSPYLHRIEVWPTARASAPLRHSLTGMDRDTGFSTRAVVVPLVQGLAAGQSLYLRVEALASTPVPVSIEPLAEVHRQDLAHVGWRMFVLSMMVMLSLLAVGLWIGIGDRSYLFLFLTLAAQMLYLVCIGGEVRALPWLAHWFSADLRMIRLVTMVAVIASSGFVAYYLNLSVRQPGLMRILATANLVMLALMVVSLFSAAGWIARFGNVVLLVILVGMLVAAVVGAWRRQREAYFVLLSWTPMVMLAVLRVGEIEGLWAHWAWTEYAVPVCCVLSGLVLMTGVTYKIQQLRQDRDRASELATFDTLTGALTRTAFEERLRAAVERARQAHSSLSLVFFDIDHFKRINDAHGHRMGDQTLRIVVLRARNRLRTGDLLGRYGGDEMVVLLPDTYLEQATVVAEHLRDALNCRPLSIDGVLLRVSMSLGVAELADGESAEQLLERADTALYASKSAGRDRVTSHRVTTTTARAQGALT
ncbi:diguanylate cyclase [Lysobacter cavernae]|uniref:diguanylate cyclase n=1 Tax=Lysobacter cavernae TaxID=1685901 RepID=A0ABV7RRN9_9GAMM